MPDAKAAALGVLDFWLERGADGYRLDVANAYLHDDTLADNPPVPMQKRTAGESGRTRPICRATATTAICRKTSPCWTEIRRTVEHYAIASCSANSRKASNVRAPIAAPDEGLHAGYTFFMLRADELSPDFVTGNYALLPITRGTGPAYRFSNHDVIRTVSRFGGGAGRRSGLGENAAGAAVLDQRHGAAVPGRRAGPAGGRSCAATSFRDPVGDLYYPLFKGRDGCRTPMPWDADAPNLGFSSGTPWLPLGPQHRKLAVSEQTRDSQSALNFARSAMKARKENAALRLGEIEFLDVAPPVLAFMRTHESERVLCVFNMSREQVMFQDARISPAKTLDITCGDVVNANGELVLGPLSAWLGRL